MRGRCLRDVDARNVQCCPSAPSHSPMLRRNIARTSQPALLSLGPARARALPRSARTLRGLTRPGHQVHAVNWALIGCFAVVDEPPFAALMGLVLCKNW